MKDLRVTNEELLLLKDAVNLLESAYVFTSKNESSTLTYKCRQLQRLRERIRIAYED